MTDFPFTHQLQIFTSSSANRDEVERNFPYKDDEENTFSLGKAPNTLIILRGGLNDEQQKWLALQKGKGIIERWRVDPLYGAKRREENVVTKELRLTFELVPQPCWYSNLRDKMPRSAWDKLRKQIYAQYNNRCGICQTANVTLNCHEIWQYDDGLHIQKLQGFIALCPMCHHCKHIGFADILADQGKLDFNEVIEHFMRVNQCSLDEYEAHSSQAWKTWRERNKFEWTTDLGSYAHLISTTT